MQLVVLGLEEVHDFVAQVRDRRFAGLGLFAHVHGDGVGRRRDGQRIVRDDAAQRVEEQQQSRASGVDHAGLLQHRELLGRESQRVLGAVTRRTHQLDQRLAVSARSLGGGARYGEHGAFHDAHDGPAGQDVGVLERLGQKIGRHVALDRKLRDQTAKHLGEDDPGVAPRAHERAVGDGLADLGHLRVVGQGAKFGGDGLDGERHIGPGVAVGHRIDVESIDDIHMRTQEFGVGGDR